MDLYPLDVVLAVSVAWAVVFFTGLPTRLLAENVVMRSPVHFGLAWFFVAATAPLAILHFHLALGLVCFYGWHRLRQEHRLSGKAWLIAAAGLGLSIGVVLILAVTPGAWNPNALLFEQTLRLAALYLGGAIVGLAVMLHAYSRRAFTQAGFPALILQRYSQLLVLLALLRALLLLSGFIFDLHATTHLGPGNLLGNFLLLGLPFVALFSRGRLRGPAPSTAAAPLFAIYVTTFLAEVMVRT